MNLTKRILSDEEVRQIRAEEINVRSNTRQILDLLCSRLVVGFEPQHELSLDVIHRCLGIFHAFIKAGDQCQVLIAKVADAGRSWCSLSSWRRTASVGCVGSVARPRVIM